MLSNVGGYVKPVSVACSLCADKPYKLGFYACGVQALQRIGSIGGGL